MPRNGADAGDSTAHFLTYDDPRLHTDAPAQWAGRGVRLLATRCRHYPAAEFLVSFHVHDSFHVLLVHEGETASRDGSEIGRRGRLLRGNLRGLSLTAERALESALRCARRNLRSSRPGRLRRIEARTRDVRPQRSQSVSRLRGFARGLQHRLHQAGRSTSHQLALERGGESRDHRNDRLCRNRWTTLRSGACPI